MSSFRARRERRLYRQRMIAAGDALRDILQSAAGARLDSYGFYTGRSVVLDTKWIDRLRVIAEAAKP